MIAPIQRTEEPPPSPAMRRAHWLVAATLLSRRSRPAESGQPVRAWKAWVFAAWVVAAAAAYFVSMLALR